MDTFQECHLQLSAGGKVRYLTRVEFTNIYFILTQRHAELSQQFLCSPPLKTSITVGLKFMCDFDRLFKATLQISFWSTIYISELLNCDTQTKHCKKKSINMKPYTHSAPAVSVAVSFVNQT